MSGTMIELLAKLTKAKEMLDECYLLYANLDYGDVEETVDLDKLTDYLSEGQYDVEQATAIVEGTVAWYLEESHDDLESYRKKWAKDGYKGYYGDDEEDDDGDYVDEESGIRCNKWGEPIFDGDISSSDGDDEVSTECDDDEDDCPAWVSADDVPYPERSPWDDTVSNEAERTRKDTAEKFKPWWKLDVSTGILTSREGSEKLYDGEWDVSKGMRLSVIRKKGDSVHVVVPCKLEKNAKLHHFTNAGGVNMSAIYTENEDGEFWVEEASCMLSDEEKMITWWNELHGKK